MKNIKCLYALSSMCRGSVAQRGLTVLVLSAGQPIQHGFLHPPVQQTISQSQVVPPSNNPRPS